MEKPQTLNIITISNEMESDKYLMRIETQQRQNICQLIDQTAHVSTKFFDSNFINESPI